MEHELQHAVGVVVVYDAVRPNREESGEERAACTRDDLGDAIGRVQLARRVLRCEALVSMHVAGQVDVRVAGIHVLYQLVDVGRRETRRRPLGGMGRHELALAGGVWARELTLTPENPL